MATVVFDGMLKLHLGEANVMVDRALKRLPAIALPIKFDKRHVSLVHQRLLKPYRKELKVAYRSDTLKTPPRVKLGTKVHLVSRGGRMSWFLVVQNSKAMRRYINDVMASVGAGPAMEPDRLFHVSIANLTGSRKDSVGDVSKADI